MTQDNDSSRGNRLLGEQIGQNLADAWPDLELTWGGGKPLTLVLGQDELSFAPPQEMDSFVSWIATVLSWGGRMTQGRAWKKNTDANKAEEFARWAHAGQWYGSAPYVKHVEEVVAIVTTLPLQVFGNEEHLAHLRSVAWLHDVLEDTPVTQDFLASKFGDVVSVAVATLSDEELPTRRERKEEIHRRLKLVSAAHLPYRLALIVKVADRLANVRSCVRNKSIGLLKMYVKEHDAFRDAVYRPDLCDSWWNELELITRG